MYTRYCGEVGTGFIDHQLHFPMNLRCTGFQTTVSAQWTALGISDHRPLSATYNVSGGRRTELSKKITNKEYQTPVFDSKDEDMCRELEGALAELLARQPPTIEMSVKSMDILLEEISTLSANTIRKCNMRRNASYNTSTRSMKGGWSPHMRALTAQLTMMIEIRRHLSGFAKRKRWANAAETRSGIQRLVWGWDEVVKSIRWKNDEARTAATVTSRPREFWLDDFPSKEVVSQEINILLSKMHGRKRTEERMKISQAVRDRELRRKANKIGSVIQSVVGEKRVNFDMSCVAKSVTNRGNNSSDGDSPTAQ